MRNLVFIILLGAILGACKTKKKVHVLLEKYNPSIESDSLLNDLKANGVDSFIVYNNGCSGCVKGSKIYSYIFWQTKGECFVKKISNYGIFTAIKLHKNTLESLLRLHKYSFKDSFSSNPNKIKWSHYKIESIQIQTPNIHNQYEVKSFEKTDNPNLPIITFINGIKAVLFDIPNYRWKLKEFETEKVKLKLKKDTAYFRFYK